jgi:hypothetical protein
MLGRYLIAMGTGRKLPPWAISWLEGHIWTARPQPVSETPGRRRKILVTVIKIAQFERGAARKLSSTFTDIQAFEKRPSPWRTGIFLPSGAGITKTGPGTRYASDAIELQPPPGTPPGSRFCKAATPAIPWICTHGSRIASNLG